MRKALHQALEKRQPILSTDTNAVRLVDGAGDGIPNVMLESFADHWLVSTTTSDLAEEVRNWLREQGHACYWKQLDQHQKDSPTHLSGPEVNEPFLIKENGIQYEISFQSGYSQGIFLDQRDNRAEVKNRMQPGLRLLNTFAYTGAFSVSAAMAGAETTTLDLSQPYLDWAKRNLSHNELDPEEHYFCKGDTFHWLKRFAKQGRTFDAIVLDPPTFSRDDKGKVFRVEKHFGELAALASKCLAKDGWMLCCTNYRRMTPREFEQQLLSTIPRKMSAKHSAMPADFTDMPYLKSVWLH